MIKNYFNTLMIFSSLIFFLDYLSKLIGANKKLGDIINVLCNTFKYVFSNMIYYEFSPRTPFLRKAIR